MRKGDIVLIPFPFTDLSGNNLRPAVVLFRTGSDVTVTFISSQKKFNSAYEIEIMKSDYNGLKVDSILKLSKIATLDSALIVGKLGALTTQEISQLNDKLMLFLNIK